MLSYASQTGPPRIVPGQTNGRDCRRPATRQCCGQPCGDVFSSVLRCAHKSVWRRGRAGDGRAMRGSRTSMRIPMSERHRSLLLDRGRHPCISHTILKLTLGSNSYQMTIWPKTSRKALTCRFVAATYGTRPTRVCHLPFIRTHTRRNKQDSEPATSTQASEHSRTPTGSQDGPRICQDRRSNSPGDFGTGQDPWLGPRIQGVRRGLHNCTAARKLAGDCDEMEVRRWYAEG